MNNILDNYILPGDANEALAKKGMQSVPVGDGVARLMSGHDGGVSYRFFIHAEYNAEKSRLAGYEVHDEIEMIEWHKSRKQKPTERVRFLPDALLTFDRDGKCVGGRYMEAYLGFKSGQGAVGKPLDQWNELSLGQIKSLNGEGVFTVEQFADWPEAKVGSVFNQSFVDAHVKAVQYVGGSDMRERSKEQVDKMLNLEQQNAKLQDRLDALEQKANANGSTKRKRGRPKKETVSEPMEATT